MCVYLIIIHVKYILGFIFGIWNSHTSIGNIIGTLLAGCFVEYNWGLSFIVPGIFIIASGILNFLFLVDHPSDINGSSHLNENVQNGRKVSLLFNVFKFVYLHNMYFII